THSLLVLSNVNPAQAGGYSALVSNPYGSAASQTGQVLVVVPPQIVADPVDQAATKGGAVTLSGAATGTDPLAYQWDFQGAHLLTGATGTTLVINHISPAQAGNYSATVSSPYGSASSLAAQVTVLTAPLVLSSPTNVVATNGDMVFLS